VAFNEALSEPGMDPLLCEVFVGDKMTFVARGKISSVGAFSATDYDANTHSVSCKDKIIIIVGLIIIIITIIIIIIIIIIFFK
jgi:hypothetical protein